MSDERELQRVIADAWSAGYAAREAELVCRRRSSRSQHQAEIAKLTRQVLGPQAEATQHTTQQEPLLVS